MKARLFTFFLIFMWHGLPEEVASQPLNPQGELSTLGPDNIWAQTLTGSHFNEFWTWHFFMDDGMLVTITFSAANFGNLKSPVTGVRVSVVGLEGNTWQLSREYPIEELIQNKETGLFQLREGREVWFKGRLPEQMQVRVETTKDGISYDIHLFLEDIAPGFKLGDGIYRIGSEEIGIFTHIPFARTKGYVEVNGTRKEVSGTAHMDHTFQNQTTTRLMDSGYRFIAQNDRDNWDIVFFFLPAGERHNRTIGHYLNSRNGSPDIFTVHSIENVSTSRLHGKRVARDLQLQLMHPQGAIKSVRLNRTADLERFSMLSELSWVERRVARGFLGGEVLEFRGKARFNLPSEAEIGGFYNFFLVD
ncbi:MAG: hypothetical protein LAT75_00750 [Candidatus Cyclonatronum sp.]|uniref:hypothetical protein n=1 Tax=Cyclonatronum sp. TaxID=3024185 RepID=UPI0025B931B3|nr:hypothetical protein [Cyclonatronum sp.]MCC5934833.1 hypothetical protein [Balneolales bacterium]MCH8485361.1 hypothetical protein [Cyclonatronum sp.]